MIGFGIGPIGGGGGVAVRNVNVAAGATGAQVTLVRLLGSASTFSLLSGTDANLTLSGGNKLALASGLTVSAVQTALVREQVGSGATARAVEYAVNCTGVAVAPSLPAVTLSAGNGQISVAWTDGSNGGAPITSHRIYLDGVLVASPTGASPYVITGLANGVSYSVQVSAVNSAGEGARSSVQSTTPTAVELVAPTNTDMVFFGDSRFAYPQATSVSSTGVSIQKNASGQQCWLPALSNQKLREGRWGGFGISSTTSTQWLTNPRVAANGSVVQGNAWRGSGTSNLGTDDVAAHPAGIVYLMDPTNDTGTAAESQANMLTLIQRFRAAGKVVLLSNGTPRGIANDGSLQGGTSLDPVRIAIKDYLNSLDCQSGSPNAIPGVYVIDTYSAFIDPASAAVGGFRNRRGLLYDGVHDSIAGAMVRAQAVVDRLSTTAWYQALPSRVTMPTADGLTTAYAQQPYLNSNPIMTPGTNGAIGGGSQGTINAAGICQGWVVTGGNAALNIAASKGSTNENGDYYQELYITGTLSADSSVYFENNVSGQATIDAMVAAGKLSMTDRLYQTGDWWVEPGAQGLAGMSLGLVATCAAGPSPTALSNQSVTVFGWPGSSNSWANASGLDTQAGRWNRAQGDYLDLAEPMIQVATPGTPAATSYSLFRHRWTLNLSAGTVAVRVRIGPNGIYRVTPAPTFAPLTLAKYNGDSRTANSGGRSASASLVTVAAGNNGVNMAGYIQAVCGNPFLLREGYQGAVGGSTTLAHLNRAQSTNIATTGNPAYATTGASPDNIWSQGADGLVSDITQSGSHIISPSVGVNDGGGVTGTYYNAGGVTAINTLKTIANIADLYGQAGKVWYVGNELAKGCTHYAMEAKTVTGGTCTATNTTRFIDGDSYNAVGVVGFFSGSNLWKPLTKVASAPGQDQYTVTSSGVYTFGGTAPDNVFLTYNAQPNGGLSATATSLKIINEFMNSSAANFVSTVNGVDYGIPGLQYQRPWVRVADTFNAYLDTSSGSLQIAQPGMLDNLQLHGTQLAAYRVAKAIRAKMVVDYPSLVTVDQRPTRNNWWAARGTGSATVFGGTLPPTMRTSFTGSPAPTLISLDGVPIGKVDTATGAITGSGITSGSLNFSTGVFTLTLPTAPANNSRIWFEQDIGNFDLATMTEGTIGRNAVYNGLFDMTPATGGSSPSGSNLTTTTGTVLAALATALPASSVPYGWDISGGTGAALATGVTNGTITLIGGSDTKTLDGVGYPRFMLEMAGYETSGGPLLQIQQYNINGFASRANIPSGAYGKVMSGSYLAYMPPVTRGRTYGTLGHRFQIGGGCNAVPRNSPSGTVNSTGWRSNWGDGATGMYIGDELLAEEGGELGLHYVSPTISLDGMTTITNPAFSISLAAAASVPFSVKLGMTRAQVRRRNDFGD